MTTSQASDRTRLAPEDALTTRPGPSPTDTNPISANLRNTSAWKSREQRRNRSRSRRRKGVWKKLLWVRQSYPDNYTDEETFLDALQRNPRPRPYEFWPLVADSTVIVQQICTMIVFVCCFSGIIQDRVSPITVVSIGTSGTVLGWVLWDAWVGQEQALAATVEVRHHMEADAVGSHPSRTVSRSTSHKDLHSFGQSSRTPSLSNLTSLTHTPRAPTSHANLQALTTGFTTPTPPSSGTRKALSRRQSSTSVKLAPIPEPPHDHHQPTKPQHPTTPKNSSHSYYPPLGDPSSRLTPRTQQRLATAKSALLIYAALLGLSPILKSLTKSTASDSIWAIAFWLMLTNVVFFDYGGGVGATFPASLSTNAALMASTVLASRLPSTIHVFSLTLFSIEVFGLFPVFRRYLRHISWDGHLSLTCFLVMAAGGGVAVSSTGGGWKAAVLGVVLGCLLTGLAMGLCSWWLIGLQRYKNEIYGPWDPARPVIRRWEGA